MAPVSPAPRPPTSWKPENLAEYSCARAGTDNNKSTKAVSFVQAHRCRLMEPSLEADFLVVGTISAKYRRARLTEPETPVWGSGWCIVHFSSGGHNESLGGEVALRFFRLAR